MSTQPITSDELPKTVIVAIRRLLRPLIRMLLSHGITFQLFGEIVKSVYVKVAEEEFRLENKEQTDSRVSLLTGIHRREVNRLRHETVDKISLSQNASMSALLLTIWSGHAEFLDDQGLPVALPRLAGGMGDHSFESLVQSVSKDFRPRVVLDEWLRKGIVSVDSEDRVHLIADAFAQPQDMGEKIFYFGKNIHDHLAAAVYNVSGGMPPFLERCVYYDKLSADSVRELDKYAQTAGMRALHAYNKRAAELQKRDQALPDSVYRTNFGVYNFSEKEDHHDDHENSSN
jgi:hypothetical protein